MIDALLPSNHHVKIEGPTVLLQPISEDQINERYLGWLNDPEIKPFIESSAHKEQSFKDITGYINNLRSNPPGELFAIFSKRTGLHVGNIGISLFIKAAGIAGYGIMIGDVEAQKTGCGGEASALMIEYLFRDATVRKIQGGAMSTNPRAWLLMKSLGYQREGILREQVVTASGEVCDWYQYGMLRREWDRNFRVKLILKHMRVTPLVADRVARK